VADQNLTGSAQVVDELQGTAVTRTYSYGLELINERQTISGTPKTSFYGYDGHGSVRFLTDSTGAVTDRYDYDAFGNVLSQTGTTPNNNLFAGEQFDPALGIYYNRARYYDQRAGRFWSMDTHNPKVYRPATFHSYLYASANPVNRRDPSGHDDIEELDAAMSLNETVESIETESIQTTEAAASESIEGIQEGAEAEALQSDAAAEIETVESESGPGNTTEKIGKLSRYLKRSQKEIREAIHAAKRNLPKSGPIRNPDVAVDLDTGEIYPKVPGGLGDSIGNIFDYLPDIIED
jgi:RHS repeat-associated protein